MVTPVRPLAKGDMRGVLAIEAEANPMPWREGDFQPFVQAGRTETSPEAAVENVHGWPHGGVAVKMAWVWAEAASHAGDPADPSGRPAGVPETVIRGFACAAAVADEVELQAIAVAKEARGHRIGTSLLEALLDWAKEAGYRSLHLEVRAGNVPALALYRRFGFAQVGCRRGYYQDNGEDALLLTREIKGPL